ncbi:MAG: efflux RND transporter periplasmic adaptor subunit [Thermoanaerobaculia bacterium]
MKRTLLLLLVVAAIAAGAFWWLRRSPDQGQGFTTEPLGRGDITSVVSATGTLQAIDTVDVGSQVSGTLYRIAADFNDHVRRGQVLAEIDPAVLDAAVVDAEAGVARAQAQLDQAEADLRRSQPLFDQGLISASQLDPLATAVRTSQAALRSAQAGLERARRNRGYAVIVAPTDGVVIDRAVEVGQTVAASFNTPKLFTLAKDLSQMQILADVDEGDIGQVHQGQEIDFTVATYPGESMKGEVQQIRLQPKTVQNVVTYTVVASAPNPQGRLLPGMTATVDFVVERLTGVLKVPSAALRFRPSAEQLAALRKARQAGNGEGAAGQGERRWGGGGGPPNLPANARMLWLLEDGQLRGRPVRLGASDGRYTAVEPLFGELEEGALVVTGQAGVQATSTQPGATSGTAGRRPGGRFPLF